MSVYYVVDDHRIAIKGKTYPYRELMRALGGQYQAADKIWWVENTPANLQQVTELCKRIGGGLQKSDPEPTSSPSTPSHSTRVASPTRSSPVAHSPLFETAQETQLTEFTGITESATEAGDGFSIAELMQKAQLALAQSFPRSIWVLGEIQNIRWHTTGCFFQLADQKKGASKSATVTVNATLWRSQFRDLERKYGPLVKDILQDGFLVRVLADITLFKDRGQISLQIQGLDPNYTKGSLALAREKLLRELRAKGLDQHNKQLKLSPFPLKIGLLSAEDSRAKSDFLDQLMVYGFPGQVIFQPCQMQGENTLTEVVKGLSILQEAGCDAIVLTRGGGSAADLRWFDSSEIAYAIAGSKVPVIAAIGHHEDVCVAEDICFQREKTPTAAADFILSVFQKTRERIDQLSLVLGRQLDNRIQIFDALLGQLTEKMRGSVQSSLHDQHRSLDQIEASLALNWQRRFLALNSRIDHYRNLLDRQLRLSETHERGRLQQLVDTLRMRAALPLQKTTADLQQGAHQLRYAVENALRAFEQKQRDLSSKLKEKDPRPWMLQGWTQLYDSQGPIRMGQGLVPGRKLQARLPDSIVSLTVDSVKESKIKDLDAKKE